MRLRFTLILIIFVSFICTFSQIANAAFTIHKYAVVIVNYPNGNVLHAVNANQLRHPASLTKMMTLYMVFKALDEGKLQLQQHLPVSYMAESREPSKLGLKAGQAVTVENLILGLVTRSANDAATVIAETLGNGSETEFGALMTEEARQLGMSNTVFVNASGLPDPRQVTTANDMVKLACALIKQYPTYYHFFSTRQFAYNGKIYQTHNHLLNWYNGADGIKTGYINASGFNIVISAVRHSTRLIGVLMGGETAQTRDMHISLLLDGAFQKLQSIELAQAR